MIKRYSNADKPLIKKVKQIGLSGSLALSLFGTAMLVQSCNSSDQNGAEGEYEEVEEYTKGVITKIEEVKPGEFKIVDEQQASIGASLVEIKYLDGKVLHLKPEEAKSLIDKELATNTSINESANLPAVLLLSGMGYLLAKTTSPTYAQYRPDLNPKLAETKKDSTVRHRHGSGLGFLPFFFMRHYASTGIYNRSQAVHQSINNSRTVSYRPVGGKTGFFGRSSSGRFGG